jgi:heme-degrading monooxygenase HmoA
MPGRSVDVVARSHRLVHSRLASSADRSGLTGVVARAGRRELLVAGGLTRVVGLLCHRASPRYGPFPMVPRSRAGETGQRNETSTREVAMMTVVTTTRLRPGGEEEWDTAMRDRFDSARGRAGWISGQLLIPEDERDTRTIVGTWRSREDWKAWHDDPAFLEQRTVLERLEAEPNRTQWFDLIADARAEP